MSRTPKLHFKLPYSSSYWQLSKTKSIPNLSSTHQMTQNITIRTLSKKSSLIQTNLTFSNLSFSSNFQTSHQQRVLKIHSFAVPKSTRNMEPLSSSFFHRPVSTSANNTPRTGLFQTLITHKIFRWLMDSITVFVYKNQALYTSH